VVSNGGEEAEFGLYSSAHVYKSVGLNKTKSVETMDEQRKHVILFAATLPSARRLLEWMDPDKPSLTKQFCMDRPINEAAFI
jgi:hypothetical protein